MSGPAISRFPDPILKQPTTRLARVDAEAQTLIQTLIRVMQREPHCVGLAAPQIGSSLRIAVMDASRHPKVTASRGLLVLVNPQITAHAGVVVRREGCLSIPDFTATVQRAASVRLRAWDAEGHEVRHALEGFEAIIAQHEIDHLEGMLFLDRVANLKTDVFRRKTYL